MTIKGKYGILNLSNLSKTLMKMEFLVKEGSNEQSKPPLNPPLVQNI